MKVNMVFRFFSVFFLILILNSNANSECAFTGDRTGGQEGLLNDAGICIDMVHRQVYRMTVRCLDHNFNRIIWDGTPRVGDFIDTLGCNAIRVRPYTRRQRDTEELYMGCVVNYSPVQYKDGHQARPGPLSEHKNWDFSLLNSRDSYCNQSADINRYLVYPGRKTDWRSLDDTAFVTSLYKSILDRSPDPAGLKHWIGLLKGGKSRESVISWFFKSPEYKTRNKNDYGYVRDLYQATHGREPSPDEVERALNKLSRGNSRQQLLDSEIYSNSASSQTNTLVNNCVGAKQGPNNNSQSYTKQPCGSVVGKWRWFNGNVATFSSDGTMGGNPIYIWHCNGNNPVRVTINWNGKWIDKLTLSSNGNRLEGKNQYGTKVWGNRMESTAVKKQISAVPAGFCPGHDFECYDKYQGKWVKFKNSSYDKNEDGRCDICGLQRGNNLSSKFKGKLFCGDDANCRPIQ